MYLALSGRVQRSATWRNGSAEVISVSIFRRGRDKRRPLIVPSEPSRETVPVTAEFERFSASLLDGQVDRGDLVRLAARARLVYGIVKVEMRDDRLDVAVTAAVTAEQFARWLLLEEAYLVSGDAHQASWAIYVKVGDLDDPYQTRIAVTRPVVGPWELRIRVEGRPHGPLPAVVAGASPAYPVAGSDVLVTNVTFSPHRVEPPMRVTQSQ
jgi:hypothetical protein